ncbi:hypothetical protein CMI37_24255 [Candidatus Pacearchaeota archaeon]|jgi:hypothetical protein|nr:hypothetical protein [Candidatus Pacearchaeota archaeon]|tara:strand:+ start:3029 stop:4126 length:1098 start_codon:yes stop_codon:yes gene_type:complete
MSSSQHNSLSSEQKEKILNEWNSRLENPPALLELIRIAYPDRPDLDGRSKEGREIKAFLATRKIKAHGAHEYQAKEKINLTEEQKQFVESNASMMNGREIACIIFADNELTNLHQEVRSVNDHIKSLDLEPYENPNEVPNSEYKPPKTFDKTVNTVNRYVNNEIDKNKITSSIKKNIDSLINYLSTYRFSHQINTYSSQTDRELFESSFIRYTHDKPDLSQEEVDQYIVLSTEVIIAASIQRRTERLQELLDTAAEDTEGRRIAMALVDAISSAQTEYNQCINRQQKLLDSLKQKRSDVLKNKIKENASVLNLVQLWKEEESRKKLIQLANIRKKAVSDEVENLTGMDEIKCRILGLSKGEVLDE